MARMTENMNLQQALYKRIEQVGKGIVDIKESSRVSEMREGEDGRWVGLRIGEDHWVRGSLVVSPPVVLITCPGLSLTADWITADRCRSAQTGQIPP